MGPRLETKMILKIFCIYDDIIKKVSVSAVFAWDSADTASGLSESTVSQIGNFGKIQRCLQQSSCCISAFRDIAYFRLGLVETATKITSKHNAV